MSRSGAGDAVVGALVARLRARRGYSRNAFARRIGLGQSHLRSIEHGSTLPGPRIRLALEAELGIKAGLWQAQVSEIAPVGPERPAVEIFDEMATHGRWRDVWRWYTLLDCPGAPEAFDRVVERGLVAGALVRDGGRIAAKAWLNKHDGRGGVGAGERRVG